MKTRRLQAFSALVVCFGLVNCSKSQDKPAPATPAPATEAAPEPAPTPVDVETTPTPASGTAEGTSPSEAAPEAPKAAPLSDEQICMVLDLANTAEIEQGKWAQKYAKHGDVKKLATMMVDEHTKSMQKQTKLETKHHFEPAESPVSTELKSESASTLAELKKVPVEDFDRVYVDQVVKAHQEILDLIDKRMIPSATNPDLITFLTEKRSTIAHHLAKAEEVQKKLGAAKPAEGMSAPKK